MNKEKQIEDLKTLYSETKDLNKQYFENIVRLMKNMAHLKIISAFELIIIILLLGSHISQ